MKTALIPSDPGRRRQLWERFKQQHPQMAAEITAVRKTNPDIKLTSFTVDGVEYRNEPAPTNVHTFDLTFIRERLPARERAQLFLQYGIGTEQEQRMARELIYPKKRKRK